jgi:hypothetical protein
MARSIAATSLLHPIGLTDDGELIYGATRLAAYRHLGKTTIPANIYKKDQLRNDLMGIDENLTRTGLSALDEAEELARRKEIYLVLYPETGVGKRAGKPPRGNKNERIASFAEDAARKTGKTERTVQQRVAIAHNIPQDIRDAIRGTSICRKKKDLTTLSKLPRKTQDKYAELVGEGKDKEAAKLLRKPRKPKRERAPFELDRAIRLIEDAIGEHWERCPVNKRGKFIQGIREILDNLDGED